MTFSKDTNLFYKQYDLDYKVQGNGEHVIEADRLKLNVYFDIHKRADDLARVQMAITTQTEVVQAVFGAGKPVPKEDRETFKEGEQLHEDRLLEERQGAFLRSGQGRRQEGHAHGRVLCQQDPRPGPGPDGGEEPVRDA